LLDTAEGFFHGIGGRVIEMNHVAD